MEAGPSSSSQQQADQAKENAASSTAHDAELAMHMTLDQMKDDDIDSYLIDGGFMGGSQEMHGKEKLLDANFFNAFPDIFAADYVDQPL
jgi:hypothetical protein